MNVKNITKKLWMIIGCLILFSILQNKVSDIEIARSSKKFKRTCNSVIAANWNWEGFLGVAYIDF